jgi:hypothetical protein
MNMVFFGVHSRRSSDYVTTRNRSRTWYIRHLWLNFNSKPTPDVWQIGVSDVTQRDLWRENTGDRRMQNEQINCIPVLPVLYAGRLQRVTAAAVIDRRRINNKSVSDRNRNLLQFALFQLQKIAECEK